MKQQAVPETGRKFRGIPGFSIIEMVVVLGVVFVLAALMLPALASAKSKAQRIHCVNNLKQMGLAFRLWANDNNDSFPMQVPKEKGGSKEAIEQGQPALHFRAISNELGSAKVLYCPSDSRRQAQNFSKLEVENISYFIGVDAEESKPLMLLAGDRNVTNGLPVKNTLLELPPERDAGWTSELHRGVGNVGMSDGSVQQLTMAGLRMSLKKSGDAKNRVQVPEKP